MTTVSPKLQDEIADQLIEIAGTKNAGASEAIEAYIYIRRATLHELKGVFTKEEAAALADMYNATLLTPRLQVQPEVIRAEIEDSERYENTCSRHGANMDELLKKTDVLTAAQVFVLQQELVRAWNNQEIQKMIDFLSNDKIIINMQTSS